MLFCGCFREDSRECRFAGWGDDSAHRLATVSPAGKAPFTLTRGGDLRRLHLQCISGPRDKCMRRGHGHIVDNEKQTWWCCVEVERHLVRLDCARHHLASALWVCSGENNLQVVCCANL